MVVVDEGSVELVYVEPNPEPPCIELLVDGDSDRTLSGGGLLSGSLVPSLDIPGKLMPADRKSALVSPPS